MRPERSLKPPGWEVDGPVMCYLALTAILSLSLPQPGALPMLHLALMVGILVLRKLANTRFGPLYLLYSVPLVPLLYLELDRLTGLAGGRLYDDVVMRWELALFGGSSPAMWLSERFPSYWLSEVLHFCYLSYYPMLFFLAYRFFRSGELVALKAYLGSIHVACFTIYLIQMFFPVQGPRPLFPPLAEELRGPFWSLCHYLCGQGAAAAAAFPSGHVTFAVAVTVAARRWDAAAYRLLLPITVGMTLATVYGRFHYAVDALAGTLIGWLFMEFWSAGGGDKAPTVNDLSLER